METIVVKIENGVEVGEFVVKEEPYEEQTSISNVNKSPIVEIKKERVVEEPSNEIFDFQPPIASCDISVETISETKVEEEEFPDSHFTIKNEILMSEDDESSNDNAKSQKTKEEKYRCDFCGVTRKKKDQLKVHVELHVYGPYKCDYCQKEFTRKDRMKYHILSHFILRKRKAPAKSTKKEIIIDHEAAEKIRINMQAKVHRQVCHICGRIYDRRNQLTLHMKLVHNVTPKTPTHFRCKYCDKVYKSQTGIYEHEKIHTEGAAICKICNKIYSSHINLYQHMRVHTKQRFKCTTCNQEFPYKQTLKKHVLAKHTEQKPGALQCRFCNIRLSNPYNLKRHIQNVHLGLDQCICKFCDKKCSRRDHLKHHLMKVHKISEQEANSEKNSSRCNLKTKIDVKEVSQEFPDSNIIVKEEVMIDDEIVNEANFLKIFKCDYCNQIFPRKKVLKAHVESHVYGAFECDICKKRFLQKQKLQQHLLSKHVNVNLSGKIVGRIVDDKTVAEAEEIIKKMRSKPLRNKSTNICHICGKSFSSNSHLTRHLKIHSRPVKKDVSCVGCDKKFGSEESLEVHCIDVHGLILHRKL